MYISGPVHFPDEQVAGLTQTEAKLVLAIALENHDSDRWLGTQVNNLIADLALAIFGPNGKQVVKADSHALQVEAHREWVEANA